VKILIVATASLAAASCATAPGSVEETSGQPQQIAGAEPALATEAPVPTEPVSENDADPNRMVCRTERVTGQLRRERICRTAAEWAAIRESGRAMIGRNQSTGNQWAAGQTQSDTNPH
jgi:hypothetical protein